MKAVVIEKPHVISLKEVPIPEPEKGFVRIKVMAAPICATDLEVVEGNIAANYPLIPGHEWSGIVDAVGAKEDEHWLGKRVVGSSDVVCLTCEECRSGNWRYCKDFEEIGFKRNGAYAEYTLMPSYGLVELPDSLSFAHGAMCEPLGVALGTLEKTGAKAGDTCFIMGSGSIGLCMLAAAKAIGLRKIVVCAASTRRLSVAKKLGAWEVISLEQEDVLEKMKEIHPKGTDIVIDATGIEESISLCLKLARKGGTVALAGYGRGKIMKIRIDDIHINNLKVVGAGNNWNQHKKAIHMMEDGMVNLEELLTNPIKLEEYEKGLELARTRPEGFVKAVFCHE